MDLINLENPNFFSFVAVSTGMLNFSDTAYQE
jgi:hypothetical protein